MQTKQTSGASSRVRMPFAGARQHGGYVMPRRAYLVGEMGPEVFRPHGAGMQESSPLLHGSGHGGRPVQVVFNISTPDANSFRASQDQLSRRAMDVMRRGWRTE
jgi:hypothetical protein